MSAVVDVLVVVVDIVLMIVSVDARANALAVLEVALDIAQDV